MNLLNFYTYTYGKLRGKNKVSSFIYKPIRIMIRFLANKRLPRYLSIPVPYSLIQKEKIIVSLTSFPARINEVWQVVECMKRQTVRPFRVFLWLSKEQFPKMSLIPERLIKMQDDIFQIKMVDGDLRSHKKYYYVAKYYPNNLVFLVDDDIYYPDNILEKSLVEYRLSPQSVICNYGTQITYDKSGRRLPYSQWKTNRSNKDVFFGSGGGTLFNPINLHEDLRNIELAQELTPTADDIWLNTMARISGTKIVLLSNRLILPISYMNNEELSTINNGMSQNDAQLLAIERHYGHCFDKVK